VLSLDQVLEVYSCSLTLFFIFRFDYALSFIPCWLLIFYIFFRIPFSQSTLYSFSIDNSPVHFSSFSSIIEPHVSFVFLFIQRELLRTTAVAFVVSRILQQLELLLF